MTSGGFTASHVHCRFTVQLALHSARPQVGGLTVTTGTAPNRLAMVDGMCASWVGPLVVAVWLPVLAPGVASSKNYTDLATVELDVQALFDRSDPCASENALQVDHCIGSSAARTSWALLWVVSVTASHEAFSSRALPMLCRQ